MTSSSVPFRTTLEIFHFGQGDYEGGSSGVSDFEFGLFVNLNEPVKGGALRFPELKLRIPPKKGRAILFPIGQRGRMLGDMIWQTEDVEEGELYQLRTFSGRGRQRAMYSAKSMCYDKHTMPTLSRMAAHLVETKHYKTQEAAFQSFRSARRYMQYRPGALDSAKKAQIQPLHTDGEMAPWDPATQPMALHHKRNDVDIRPIAPQPQSGEKPPQPQSGEKPNFIMS